MIFPQNFEIDKNLEKKSARIADGFIILDAIPKDKYYRLNFDKFL